MKINPLDGIVCVGVEYLVFSHLEISFEVVVLTMVWLLWLLNYTLDDIPTTLL